MKSEEKKQIEELVKRIGMLSYKISLKAEHAKFCLGMYEENIKYKPKKSAGFIGFADTFKGMANISFLDIYKRTMKEISSALEEINEAKKIIDQWNSR